jgi:hypothetical protein
MYLSRGPRFLLHILPCYHTVPHMGEPLTETIAVVAALSNHIASHSDSRSSVSGPSFLGATIYIHRVVMRLPCDWTAHRCFTCHPTAVMFSDTAQSLRN